MSIIRQTILKFGIVPLLQLIVKELRDEARINNDCCPGTGERCTVWADEIEEAIKRGAERLKTLS